MSTCSICPGSARTDEARVEDVTQLDIFADQPPEHLLHVGDHPFRSSTFGSSTCCRLKARSWRVRAAAQSPACGSLRGPRLLGLRLASTPGVPRTEDDRQQVVEVVGDAPGELPDRFHLLRLPELLLQQPLLGEVHDVGDAARLRGFEHHDADQDWNARSVLADVLLLPGLGCSGSAQLLDRGLVPLAVFSGVILSHRIPPDKTSSREYPIILR